MNNLLKVFITYSHRDKEAKDELITRLAVMVRNSLIEIWHDNEILPGDKWRESISNNLLSSDILLYLVSAASLASENCNKELAEALEKSSLRTIPIILEASDWQGHRISGFQALPDFGKPITAWRHASDGWQNVVEGIRRVIGEMSILAQPTPETDLKKSDSGDATEQLRSTNVLLMLGQWDKAVDAYSKIIELDPQNAAAYNNRGVVKANLGQYKEAIADFDATIHIDPQYADAYYNRGSAKDSLDRYEAAIADYDVAIRLDPQDADAYHNRGSAKDSLGQHEAAIADYDAALRLNPQLTEAYNNRGNAKGELDQHEEAIADFGMAIQLDPQFAAAYNNRGVAKRSLSRNEEARKDFQECLTLAKQQGNEKVAQAAQKALDNLGPA